MVTSKDTIPLENSTSQSEIHGQAAWESPGLVKMQILGPYLRSIESELRRSLGGLDTG